MLPENKKDQPPLLFGLTILFLILLSFIPADIDLGIIKTKKLDFLMDVKRDSVGAAMFNECTNITGDLTLALSLPGEGTGKRTGEEFSASYNEDTDFTGDLTLALSLPGEGTGKKTGEEFRRTGYINSAENINSASLLSDLRALLNLLSPSSVITESLSGNTAQMKYFFDALKGSKENRIRVAHYGDSAIEGDMITSDLRLNLQKNFGGYGAGFLSITSKDTRFRASTKHIFSDDWETYSITESAHLPSSPGISGSASVPSAGSWVKYEVSGIGNAPKYFNTVRLFYSKAKKSDIIYSFDSGKELKAELTQGDEIKELTLKAEGNAKSILIKCTADRQAQFFGVSLEAGSGIYVDNYPLRGNSGLSLDNIETKVLSGFNQLLNYKLIVLNFGLNLVSETSDYTRYEKQMVKVIERLRTAFPQTSFLLVSAGDKSIKKGSRFVTDPNVPKLVEVQRRIAERSGCAFWDLYKTMGGENSMHKWVTASPPLAYKDYTHVNVDGAKKIAEMLSEAILNAYRQYK